MPVPLAQVRRLAFNDEEIGMGFNSESGLAVGTAVEGFTVQGDQGRARPGDRLRRLPSSTRTKS